MLPTCSATDPRARSCASLPAWRCSQLDSPRGGASRQRAWSASQVRAAGGAAATPQPYRRAPRSIACAGGASVPARHWSTDPAVSAAAPLPGIQALRPHTTHALAASHTPSSQSVALPRADLNFDEALSNQRPWLITLNAHYCPLTRELEDAFERVARHLNKDGISVGRVRAMLPPRCPPGGGYAATDICARAPVPVCALPGWRRSGTQLQAAPGRSARPAAAPPRMSPTPRRCRRRWTARMSAAC